MMSHPAIPLSAALVGGGLRERFHDEPGGLATSLRLAGIAPGFRSIGTGYEMPPSWIEDHATDPATEEAAA